MSDKKIVWPKASYRIVDVDTIRKDSDYQRPTDEEHVEKIRESFDPKKYFIPQVAEREDGVLYCVDGWHRLKAAERAGYTSMPVLIIHSTTKEQEASIFADQGGKLVSAGQKHRARLIAGDDRARKIQEIVERRNLKVVAHSNYGANGYISCIHALYRIEEQHGTVLIDRTLEFITDVWGNEARYLQRTVIHGVAIFLLAFRQEVDGIPGFLRSVEEKLATVPFDHLMQRTAVSAYADSRGTMARAFATSIAAAFNQGKRSGALDESRIARVQLRVK